MPRSVETPIPYGEQVFHTGLRGSRFVCVARQRVESRDTPAETTGPGVCPQIELGGPHAVVSGCHVQNYLRVIAVVDVPNRQPARGNLDPTQLDVPEQGGGQCQGANRDGSTRDIGRAPPLLAPR